MVLLKTNSLKVERIYWILRNRKHTENQSSNFKTFQLSPPLNISSLPEALKQVFFATNKYSLTCCSRQSLSLLYINNALEVQIGITSSITFHRECFNAVFFLNKKPFYSCTILVCVLQLNM